MTAYELDVRIAEHRRATLTAEACRERLRAARRPVRAVIATALRRLAETLEPSPAARLRSLS